MNKIFGIVAAFVVASIMFVGSATPASAGGGEDNRCSDRFHVGRVVQQLVEEGRFTDCPEFTMNITFLGEDIVNVEEKVVGTEWFQGSDSIWRDSPIIENRFVLAQEVSPKKHRTVVVTTEWLGNGDMNGDIYHAYHQANNNISHSAMYAHSRSTVFVGTATLTRFAGDNEIFIVTVKITDMLVKY